MTVVPFELAHFHQLRLQPSQAWLGEALSEATLAQMAAHQSYTVLAGEKVAAIAGLLPHHEKRAHAWALIDRNLGAKFTTLHRIVKRYLSMMAANYPRIETTVQVDFPQGHRWAKTLGFVVEAPCMSKYDEQGRDHTLYRWGC
jgi:hypothetical protein